MTWVASSFGRWGIELLWTFLSMSSGGPMHSLLLRMSPGGNCWATWVHLAVGVIAPQFSKLWPHLYFHRPCMSSSCFTSCLHWGLSVFPVSTALESDGHGYYSGTQSQAQGTLWGNGALHCQSWKPSSPWGMWGKPSPRDCTAQGPSRKALMSPFLK